MTKIFLFAIISFASIVSSAFSTPSAFNEAHHFAKVNGIQLYYREMGKGPLVILLHGWPETSFEWRKTMQTLSNQYRVIAPDLRGLGHSERTSTGYDKKTIATDIKALIEYFGEKKVIVIGHDMGGKVAYVMAHLYPQLISKLVLVDCAIPGTENTDPFRNGAWHYGFHLAPEIPEMLTKGREKEYIRAQIKAWSFKKDAFDEETINEYAKSYARRGGMTAGFNYYRTLPDDQKFVKTFHNKLVMPILAISGRYGVGEKLASALKNQTRSLKSIIIEKSGHFVPEEAPAVFNSSLMEFLNG